MQLNLENLSHEFLLRSASGSAAMVNDRRLTASFVIAPDHLTETWPVGDARTLSAEHIAPILALNPEVIVLGTGAVQVFPAASVMAAGLGRGVGIEVMNNAAAARTFNVLASEGRRVAAGFILQPAP